MMPSQEDTPPIISPKHRGDKSPVQKKKRLYSLRRSTFAGSFLDVQHESILEVQPLDKAPPVNIFRMFSFASKFDIILMTIGLMGAIITGLTTPLNTLIYGEVLNGMVKEITLIRVNLTMGRTNSPTAYDGLMAFGRVFAIESCMLGFVVMVATYASIVVFNIAAQNQILRIRNVFLRSVLNKDIAWFDVNQSGEFASRMNDDLTKLSDGLGEKTPMLVHFLVAFLSSMFMALYQGWKMTLMCMPTLPIGFCVIGIAAFFSARLAKREMEAFARAGAIAEEVFAAIRTVVAFGGERKETARYAVHLSLARTLNIKKAFFNAIGFGCLWLFVYCTYAWSFWYGVELVLDDDEPAYTPGTMFTVFMSILMGGVSLVSTAPFVESLTNAKSAAAKVFAVISERVGIDPLADTGVRPVRCTGVLEFCDVFFDYPNRPEVRVLRGMTMTIRKGETVALVGSSGCGKSTCLQLIQRFYDPDGGRILLDDRDLRDLNVNWLRSSIGVVGQEPVLFGTTVYENIRYGRESATQLDIENAARAANAHNFIVNLPYGYETMVGERGAQMSGGQKQRIAIARALVRNPEILLLDEATSALDTASEAMVQDALVAASQGRTTVIVAHRLSTIRNADVIVVLHHGSVVEQGNHKELMALGGYYHALVTVQMGDVAEEERKMSVSAWMHPNPDHEHKRLVDVQSEDEEDDDQQPVAMSAWQLMKWNAPEKAFVVIGALCSLIQGAAMPIFAVIYGGVIETLSNPDASIVREETTINCVQLVCAGLVVGSATFMQVWSFGIAGEYLTERLRKRTFGAIMRQEMAWHDDKEHGTGALCSLLSGEAAAVQGATGQRIGTVIGSVTTTLLGIGIGMYYSWRLGFVALVFTPLILIAMHMEIRLSAQSNMGNQKALKRSTKIAVEVVSNIRTVASLGRERMFHQQYMQLLEPSAARGKRLTHVRGLVFGVARSSLFFANSACIMFGAQLVADEAIALSNVFVATQALIMGSVVIASTLAYAPNFQRGVMAASTINQLLLREPLIRDPHASNPDRYDPEAMGPWNPEGKVSFEGTEFFYPGRPSSRVLQGLYVSVKPGQSVAFVGASGCGKSTCMQLLLRFYDPIAGFVSIDNRHIETVSLATLRAQIGIVSQEPALFDRTIADNIAYGDNARRITRADVMDAAKLANIHGFIESLPMSYDTRLGSRGTQLSGGQKQRIAIARALVRRPKVLLLDEATSALDMESEKVVQAALDAASKGRTSITIAHRLSTIVNSDVIFVMHEGQVAEKGSHAELLARKGIYYRLFELQSGAVRLR